jgi:hypothetical protein
MDINNPEYCKALTGEHKELPQEFSDAVQIKNSRAELLTITDDVQLMPYAYALLSPNNERLENLLATKKIKIVSFTTNSSITLDTEEEMPKKKRQSKSSKSTSSPQQDAAVAELASIVSVPVEHDNDEKTELEAEVQPTENNLSDDDAKGTPEDNE